MIVEEPDIEAWQTPEAANARTLQAELDWFAQVLQTRLALHFGEEVGVESIYALEPPPLESDESMYASFIAHYDMRVEERLMVLLALVPHLQPQVLDIFYLRNEALNRGFAEFGGLQGKAHGGFLPTGETVLFLLSDGDLHRRFACQQFFSRDHVFARHNLLKLDTPPVGEPLFSGQLLLSDEMVDFLTTGTLRKPDYSRDFPAKLISTEMTWDDLVLAPGTLDQIRELEAWIHHEDTLLNAWGLRRRMRPGYKCLFYGPPGTGKTLTATLLGKRFGKDVYRIDLSAVVSKYIGETEKNLERIFERAENMNCLLFFDEGDAIFGKRTNVSDAHDRYANQEVSYLLQRIEDFPGLVVLATNYKSNMDDAFMRRFQAIVHFPMPNASERYRLWTGAFSEVCDMEEGLDLQSIAEKYELAGGSIMNVVRFASLMALNQQSTIITQRDLIGGVRRELQKDGKTL
ncbi:MAG TPA: ATP-binding protein [Rhodothermales bacterium]|nr:ATP-binding protein [Rhodothermales bacterium]